jgi:hypothetical protein
MSVCADEGTLRLTNKEIVMKKTLVTIILTAFALSSVAFAQSEGAGAPPTGGAAPTMQKEETPPAEAPKAPEHKGKKHHGGKKKKKAHHAEHAE